MLTHIDIRNFVLVDELSLDFSNGLHVLTGETGAGKSIWVDAISIALGSRADTSMIREGQSRCDITLCFDLTHLPAAQDWLQNHQFDQTGEDCFIRKTLQKNGTSRSTINGIPCPLKLVKELGMLLLTIHGQHQHQNLLKKEGQQQQLDQFIQKNNALKKMKALYQQWKENSTQIDALKLKMDSRHSELELLRYQLTELDTLNMTPDEWQHLNQTHRKLHHANDWKQQLQQALALTIDHEEQAALTQINKAIQLLSQVKIEDDAFKNIQTLLNEAAIQIEEGGHQLQRFFNTLDIDPKELAQIEKRLEAIHDIARKHRKKPEELPQIRQQLTDQMNALDSVDIQIEMLEKNQQVILTDYQKIADDLSRARQKAAKSLSQQLTDWMQQLGMKGGQFKITLEKMTADIHPLGHETISFLASTNPGQAFQPLSKIASGGELSRLHLALQVITAQKEQTPTLIFDEVDVGIGGQTAAIVGKLLRELGEATQVLCITHLPQVAACGHHHFKVMKRVNDNKTVSTISPLTNPERSEELARMLGGESITRQSLANAEQMLLQSTQKNLEKVK